LDQLAKSLNNSNYYTIVDHFLSNLDNDTVEIDQNFLSDCQIVNCATANKITAVDLTVITTAVIKNAQVYTFDAKLQKFMDQYF